MLIRNYVPTPDESLHPNILQYEDDEIGSYINKILFECFIYIVYKCVTISIRNKLKFGSIHILMTITLEID